MHASSCSAALASRRGRGGGMPRALLIGAIVVAHMVLLLAARHRRAADAAPDTQRATFVLIQPAYPAPLPVEPERSVARHARTSQAPRTPAPPAPSAPAPVWVPPTPAEPPTPAVPAPGVQPSITELALRAAAGADRAARKSSRNPADRILANETTAYARALDKAYVGGPTRLEELTLADGSKMTKVHLPGGGSYCMYKESRLNGRDQMRDGVRTMATTCPTTIPSTPNP